jgi:hypothetical protein
MRMSSEIAGLRSGWVLPVTWMSLCLLGCSREPAVTPEPSMPGGLDTIPTRYASLYDGRALFEQQEELWQGLPLESITLERTGCYGTCPQYTVRFERGGMARYEGREFAALPGRWTGDLGPYAFGMLCFLVERLRFEELQDGYAASWTDDETVITTVEWRDGRAKAVRDYGRRGPPELWALHRVIDSLADEIDWQPDPAWREGRDSDR